jgi:hypothetical protein
MFITFSFMLATRLMADTQRRELARTIYNFLHEHALCVDGDEFPCIYVCDDAYELHWAARELYSNKTLGEIAMPVSDWERGCYAPQTFDVWWAHESILDQIEALIFEVRGAK